MASFITLTQPTEAAPSIYIRIAAIESFTPLDTQTLIQMTSGRVTQVVESNEQVLAAIQAAEAVS